MAKFSVYILIASTMLIGSCRKHPGVEAVLSAEDGTLPDVPQGEMNIVLAKKIMEDTKLNQTGDLIDSFLENLRRTEYGPRLFSNFTAVYESAAEEAQQGTPEFPRMILTTYSGMFTVTFAGPTNGRGNHVEFAQVDPKTYDKVYYTVDFPPPQGGANTTGASLDLGEPNPELCAKCHKSQALSKEDDIKFSHIWGRYPNWKGVLGGDDDFIAPTRGVRYPRQMPPSCKVPYEVTSNEQHETEYRVLRNLRRKISTGENRYRHLVIPRNADEFYPYSNNPRGRYRFRPNFRFGGIYHRYHVKNIIHWKKERMPEEYEDAKYLFLYGFMECDANLPLPQSFRARLTYLTEESKSHVEKVNGGKTGLESQEFMYEALDLLKLSWLDFDIQFRQNKFASRYGYSAGSERSHRYLARLLMEEDKATDNKIPHDTYTFDQPADCPVENGIQEFPYLEKFGHYPVLLPDQPDATKRLCEALYEAIGLK